MHGFRRGRLPDTQLHAALSWQDDRVHLVRLQLLSYRCPGGMHSLIQQRLFNRDQQMIRQDAQENMGFYPALFVMENRPLRKAAIAMTTELSFESTSERI